MKQQVLKALANPARIFYVPYTLAVINFVVQFIIFIVIFVIGLMFGVAINPMWFMLSVIAVHMFLAVYSKRDSQLGQIIAAKIQLFRKKIPGGLAA